LDRLSSLAYAGPHLARRDWALAQLSASFLLDQITMGLGPLTTREALLVLAINQGKIAAMTRDPEARRRYGALDAPAPDDERRAVSINAVANSLGLPFETVRRQIRGLETLGVCVATPQGVIVPGAFLISPAYLESVQRGGERMRLFYMDVRKAGLLGPLPASAYEVEDGAPLRSAARLLSDFILRVSDSMRPVAGDVISNLVLLALLESSLAPPHGGPRSVSAIARRLRIPEETARRHAVRLAEPGLARRTSRGLIIDPEMLDAPPLEGLVRDNNADAQRLFAGLAERGVLAAWDQAANA
jgi:hypothetical protein